MTHPFLAHLPARALGAAQRAVETWTAAGFGSSFDLARLVLHGAVVFEALAGAAVLGFLSLRARDPGGLTEAASFGALWGVCILMQVARATDAAAGLTAETRAWEQAIVRGREWTPCAAEASHARGCLASALAALPPHGAAAVFPWVACIPDGGMLAVALACLLAGTVLWGAFWALRLCPPRGPDARRRNGRWGRGAGMQPLARPVH